VIERLPTGGEVYVEPFAGSAAILFAKPRVHPIEVLNDRDDHLVTLYRVLQDRRSFRELMRRLVWTPYARSEFERAIAVLDAPPEYDEVSIAWAVFVVHNQSYGGLRVRTSGRWMRTFDADNPAPASFRARVAELRGVRARLEGVLVDNRDALEVIDYWDRRDTVFYLDPPYHPDTRKDSDVYAADVDSSFLGALVERLLALEGQCALSGYDHELFTPLEAAGWERHVLPTTTALLNRGERTGIDADKRRTEVLWVRRHAVRQAALWG
jgi:DNA adenine methylase